MNAEALISGLERFFFDIIGQLIPGGVLLIGFFMIDPFSAFGEISLETSTHWWAILAVAYLLGSALSSLGEHVISPAFVVLSKLWLDIPLVCNLTPTSIKKLIIRNSEMVKKIQGYDAYVKFKKHYEPDISNFNQLRSIAMTVIDEGDKGTVVRFTFISLFCLGSASALIFIFLMYLSSNFAQFSWEPKNLIFLASMFLIITALLIREREFKQRALHLPFSLALAKTYMPLNEDKSQKRKVVYLAGGHRSGWQKEVQKAATGFEYKDPSSNGFTEPAQYTAWDLAAVRECDVVFAYFEESNPSGYGLALEVGYAAALGKLVIFVDEKSSISELSSYLKILHETSDVSFDNFKAGIDYLKKL